MAKQGSDVGLKGHGHISVSDNTMIRQMDLQHDAQFISSSWADSLPYIASFAWLRPSLCYPMHLQPDTARLSACPKAFAALALELNQSDHVCQDPAVL